MKLKVIHDDSHFKSDTIKNGRMIKRFCKQLAGNVFSQSYKFYTTKSALIKGEAEGENPLIHLERNTYSTFAAAIDKITPVHLSEWSFNKKDNASLEAGRRVDFWCLHKSSVTGSAINYFIEIKKGHYCLNKTATGKLPKVVTGGIRSLLEQTSSIRRLSPNWDNADDVYLGIVVIHSYFQEGKIQYDHNDLREEIVATIDKRRCAQVLVSTWMLPDDLVAEPPWDNDDRCQFVSIALVAITRRAVARKAE